MILILFFIYYDPTVADNPKPFQCALQACSQRRTFFSLKNETCVISQRKNPLRIMSSFEKVYQRSSKEITLFRIVSGSGVASYDYFMQNNNFDQFADDTHRNYSHNFRSVLLDEWKTIPPSYVNITLRNSNDSVVAYMVFKVNKRDDMESWFNKNNLIQSFPWNFKNLMQTTYIAFSMKGFTERNTLKRFYINIYFASCNQTHGVLGVFDRLDECNFAAKFKNVPEVIYVVGPTKSGDCWNQFALPAKSLEIIGIYDSSISIYA